MSEKDDNYKDDVENIARDILVNNGLNDRYWSDAAHEAVDGSSWIIYDRNNETVLDQSDNEPDSRDVAEMLSKNDQGDWRTVRRIAAFMAMEADVLAACKDLEDEYFECDDCDTVTLIEDGHEHNDGNTYCPECHKKRFRCDIGRDVDGNPVIYHSNQDNDAEHFPVKSETGVLVLTVVNGQTPIGVLLDHLDEHTDNLDCDEDMRTAVVEYLRNKYPAGNELWQMETFLDDERTDPVREDEEPPAVSTPLCGGCGYPHNECACDDNAHFEVIRDANGTQWIVPK